MEIRDRSVRIDAERVAEQGRVSQLFHQGHGELLERVAEHDDLGEGAQLV